LTVFVSSISVRMPDAKEKAYWEQPATGVGSGLQSPKAGLGKCKYFASGFRPRAGNRVLGCHPRSCLSRELFAVTPPVCAGKSAVWYDRSWAMEGCKLTINGVL
jgi:hypothetical protein